MTALFAWLVRMIGFGGVAFVALWIYVFGTPGASRIPHLTSIPILGDITAGRMNTFAADQVKLAKASCEAEKSGLVSKFELSAIQAQLNRERDLRTAAGNAASEAMKRASDALRAEEIANDQLERLREDAESNTGLSRPNESDREWLSKH